MKTNKQVAAFCIVAVIAGYIIGAVCGIPGVGPQLLNGDIGKVNKYNKQVSEDVKVFQERLQNDKEFCNQTITALAIINSRINEFKVLIDATADVAKNIPELSDEVKELAEAKELASNASEQADSALHALGYLVAGNIESGYNYEQLAQNATLSYLFIDKQTAMGKDFVEEVDKYIKGKNVDDVKEVAILRDLWQEFCTTSACLNDDKGELAYWSGKSSVVRTGTPEENQKVSVALSPQLTNALVVKETFGINIPIGTKVNHNVVIKSIDNALNNVVYTALANQSIQQLGAKAAQQLQAKMANLDLGNKAAQQLQAKKGDLDLGNKAAQQLQAKSGTIDLNFNIAQLGIKANNNLGFNSNVLGIRRAELGAKQGLHKARENELAAKDAAQLGAKDASQLGIKSAAQLGLNSALLGLNSQVLGLNSFLLGLSKNNLGLSSIETTE